MPPKGQIPILPEEEIAKNANMPCFVYDAIYILRLIGELNEFLMYIQQPYPLPNLRGFDCHSKIPCCVKKSAVIFISIDVTAFDIRLNNFFIFLGLSSSSS